MKKTLRTFLAFILASPPLVAIAEQFGDLTYSKYSTYVYITGYTGAGGAVTIPSIIDNLPVTRISGMAFYDCSSITSVTIPDSVTSIGVYAFSGCSGLANITIPSGVTSIGNSAFANGSGLMNINVVAANTSYSSLNGVLFNKNKTTLLQYPGGKVGSYMIPNGVTNIGESAFRQCSNLTGVTISGSVKSMGEQAFSDCSSLDTVTIPDGVTRIEKESFSGCSSLKSVTIPGSVTTIGNRAFHYCTSLVGVIIPDSVTGIASWAFYGCSNLSNVVIPDSVTSIGEYAFSFCSRLSSVRLPSGTITVGDNAFYYCTGLVNVTTPESLNSIGAEVFAECRNLTNVTISSGITSIGYASFKGCAKLTGVMIPGGVTSMGSSVFNGCVKLESVYFAGHAPSVGSDLFYKADNVTVYYLPGTKGWGTIFADRPTALWDLPNQPPQITGRSPAGEPVTVNEGASVTFRLTANDELDPNETAHGMLSVTWYLDGVQKLETKSGAPNAIASALTFETDADTVQGAEFRVVQVKAVAQDRQGGSAEAVWTVRVNNLKSEQTITFGNLTAVELGAPDFWPGATASSGLPVSYTSSNLAVAEIIDGNVHIVGLGMSVITASQMGNVDYGAATPITRTLWVTGALGSKSATLGESFEMLLPEPFVGAVSVTVSGLPPGLKYSSSTFTIAGVPTRAGTFDKVTLSVKGGAFQSFTMIVEPLPAWAQGTFNGYVQGGGLASMTVSAAGKVSGKISLAGTNYTFSSASYSRSDADGSTFWVKAQAKSGRTVQPLELSVSRPILAAVWAGFPVPGDLSVAESADGWLRGGQGSGPALFMWRDVWKDAAETLSLFTGYYTATLPGNEAVGSGYLTLTVDKAGKIKTAGKLADGTPVSLSGTLIHGGLGVFVPLYTVPVAYKGGRFFGLAEFVKPYDGESLHGEVYLRQPGDAPFQWESRNPQATGEYGKGFSRQLGITGGWYSKTENLYDYYEGRNLFVGIDPDARPPELAVGSTRYGSICWDPSGVVLSPVLKSSVMTGLTAPPAGKPTDPENDGTWSYSATNSVGLKLALTRPTGVFKGSFNAWFDYPVKKHVSKPLAFEGVLTPVREDPSDGVAGRGFFLWPDKSLSPAYRFNGSYDFKILTTD